MEERRSTGTATAERPGLLLRQRAQPAEGAVLGDPDGAGDMPSICPVSSAVSPTATRRTSSSRWFSGRLASSFLAHSASSLSRARSSGPRESSGRSGISSEGTAVDPGCRMAARWRSATLCPAMAKTKASKGLPVSL